MLSSHSASIITNKYTTSSNCSNGRYYWTITLYNGFNVGHVYNDGNLNERSVADTTSGVRPVIVVNNDTTITSGNGTLQSPYIID